ncbi:MAG: hypothetical protein GYA86_02285 [Firmicutes bacterium]|nr:hypothetical protein [Bacillota bacterium]
MGLYTLKVTNNDMSTGVLEKTKSGTVDYEKDFEDWLENSPNVLLDEEEGSIIWIGRQVTASVGDAGFYPDLIGIDTSGDLVIVELKKGRTPRDVIAQILEYAAWGSLLTYDDLNKMTIKYYKNQEYCNKNLKEIHQEAFFADSEEMQEVEFNKSLKLFIVAEDISPVIKQVASFLRDTYQVDISCLKYEVLKSEQGSYFISTEKVTGFTEVVKKPGGVGTSVYPRWRYPMKQKEAISDVVKKMIGNDKSVIFSASDVYQEAIKEYPDINPVSVSCQIVADCVNHTSRRHYPSGQRDLYFRIEKGKFRLYDPETDGKWNYKGEKIE